LKKLKIFYRDNIRYVSRYILDNCGTIEDVEDIFHDAMVVLYQKIKSGTLEISVPLTTYFYGICKNTWRTRLRKKHRFVTSEDPFNNKEAVMDSITHTIENEEQEQLYQKHFQRLSRDNKSLMQLYFEGKSCKEISTITGYSEGYARKKKFEAKKQLLGMIERDPAYRELAVC